MFCAGHVWVTVRYSISAGDAYEATLEKGYFGVLSVSLGTFAISLALIFWYPRFGVFVPPCVSLGGKNEGHYGILTALYLIVPTIAVSFFAIHLQFFQVRNQTEMFSLGNFSFVLSKLLPQLPPSILSK